MATTDGTFVPIIMIGLCVLVVAEILLWGAKLIFAIIKFVKGRKRDGK